MVETVSRTPASQWRRNSAFYISVLPFFTIFLAFSVFPVVFSFYLGFSRWDGFGSPVFVGLQNYVRALHDPVFQKAVANTIYLWFWSTLLTISLALALSVAINEYVAAGKTYFRMVFLVPLLVAPAIAAVVLRLFFSANGGLVNLLTGAVTGTPELFRLARVGGLDQAAGRPSGHLALDRMVHHHFPRRPAVDLARHL